MEAAAKRLELLDVRRGDLAVKAPFSGQVVARRAGEAPDGGDARDATIELVGQDRPGIVHDITAVLARLGINVLELETTVQSASMSGESLFIAHARILVPGDVPLDRLRAEMEELANELMVDIELEE